MNKNLNNDPLHICQAAMDAVSDDVVRKPIIAHFNPLAKCPECMEETHEDELRMFGGVCEECASFGF